MKPQHLLDFVSPISPHCTQLNYETSVILTPWIYAGRMRLS